jgi:hypothetical protein
VLEATDGFHLPTAILGWTVRICRRDGIGLPCAALGIVPTVRHADYLGAWLEVLQEDNRAIFRAASAASKAADWLLVRHAELKTGKRAGDATKGTGPAEACPMGRGGRQHDPVS